MSQQFLNDEGIAAIFKHKGCESVPKDMGGEVDLANAAKFANEPLDNTTTHFVCHLEQRRRSKAFSFLDSFVPSGRF